MVGVGSHCGGVILQMRLIVMDIQGFPSNAQVSERVRSNVGVKIEFEYMKWYTFPYVSRAIEIARA